MTITNESYDLISQMITDFPSLDSHTREFLYGELRCMRDHVCKVQRRNEEFMANQLKHYATLEGSVKGLEKDVAELTAENIQLAEKNLLLEAQVRSLTKQLKDMRWAATPTPRLTEWALEGAR